MQREEILQHALLVMEREGLTSATFTRIAKETDCQVEELQLLWPNQEALFYDALSLLSERINILRHQLIHDNQLTKEQKLLKRYQLLTECVRQQRYPGCLFIAACTFYPDASHPIHQIADQQKRAAWDYTYQLLSQLDVDDTTMVADQMELVMEGCLSRLLVKRSQDDIDTARHLAEDILRFAQCRKGGALT